MKGRLNDLDRLIMADLIAHPGSTQGEVVNRMFSHYRSRTYIRSGIARLIATGLIKDERTGRNASLTCVVASV
jgi:hypothetical protein